MINKKENYPRATVKEINGQVVLEDPAAVALVTAVNKANCKNTFDVNSSRVEHFKNRMQERNLTPKDVVIAFLSVDDKNGEELANFIMPNYNWQEIRDRGEKPFLRGLVGRNFIQEALEIFDKEAAEKLEKIDGIATVVVDYGVAEIF